MPNLKAVQEPGATNELDNTEIIIIGDSQLRKIRTGNTPMTLQIIAVGGGRLKHALRIMQHLPVNKSFIVAVMMRSNHLKDMAMELNIIMNEFLESEHHSCHKVLMIGSYLSPDLKSNDQKALRQFKQMLYDCFKAGYLPPSSSITITLVESEVSLSSL